MEKLNWRTEQATFFLPDDDGYARAFVLAEEAKQAHPRGEREQPGCADQRPRGIPDARCNMGGNPDRFSGRRNRT
jgi:hypothetical protein